jgi:hypothetical protein
LFLESPPWRAEVRHFEVGDVTDAPSNRPDIRRSSAAALEKDWDNHKHMLTCGPHCKMLSRWPSQTPFFQLPRVATMSRECSRRSFLGSAFAGASALMNARFAFSAEADDPVGRWQTGVQISPVSKVTDRHTMHAYYLLNPESPDGRRVVFFASTHSAGHVGQVCILDRQTGAETVLADEVHTEDAHRVALQQWTANGKAVAYHEVVNKRWRVVVVDIETRSKKIVAEDRQLGFGRGDGYLLPLYGCH